MAEVEIKAPSLGESETEATLVNWLKQEGEAVAVDDVLAEIESDKITMEVTASDAGVLTRILKQAGETITPGETIGVLDTEAEPTVTVEPQEADETASESVEIEGIETEAAEAEASAPEASAPEAAAPKAPSVVLSETGPADTGSEHARREERMPMSAVRRRIAKRLKQAQEQAAMLTTFNEVNLAAIRHLREKHGKAFEAKHGVRLGYMSFFVRAVCGALAQYPALNAWIDGDDVVYHDYADIGIAVSTDKGLLVPVLRDANRMSLAAIEKGIADLARRAREGGLHPDDLRGGTFSITNGGVFGSMLSTPILNPPQSGILGMHAIQERPVAENGQVVIRPMMYLALTYDHRLIDGADAVRFLVAVRESLEYPGGVELLEL
ncbi:MAG: dihydrolipoyllysine-residue succinyltransferase [Mariprofundaceae bacterium]